MRFVVGKVAGQVISEYFGLPCQFSFHRLLYTHHLTSSGAGTIGQFVADSISPHPNKLKKNIRYFFGPSKQISASFIKS
jgi:hypothetical protein